MLHSQFLVLSSFFPKQQLSWTIVLFSPNRICLWGLLNTILQEERGHYQESHVQSGHLSRDRGKFLLVFICNPFISCFLISSKYAKHSTKPTQVSYVDKTRVPFDPDGGSSSLLPADTINHNVDNFLEIPDSESTANPWCDKSEWQFNHRCH